MATYVLLQKFVKDIQTITGQAPVVRYNDSGAAWPARPAGAVAVIWLGGPSAPGAAVDGDIWIP